MHFIGLFLSSLLKMHGPKNKIVIEDFHYGGDELIRVADVGTQSGVFRRAVHKLCPLPVDAE